MNEPLSDGDVDDVAEQLERAERNGVPIDAFVHEPRDLADGYRIQTAGHRRRATELVAWKAGCTNEATQQLLGIDGPVFGRYGPDRIDRSPALCSFASFTSPPRLEVEVGLRLTENLDDIPADPLALADAVVAFAAIEVVDARVIAFPLISAPVLVSDNVASGRMIVGADLDCDARGMRRLDIAPVELSIGGERIVASSGAEALGHPLRVLRDVAIHAAVIGQPLRPGNRVITGTCTGLVAARGGEDHLGRVGGADVVVRFD